MLHVVRPVAGGIRKHLETIFSGINREKYLLYLAAPPSSELLTALCPFAQKIFPVPIGEDLTLRDYWRVVHCLRRILKDEGIDLIHTHGVRAAVLGQMAALGVSSARVVTTFHNSLDIEGSFFIFLRFVLGFLNRLAASQVIAVSHAVKYEICRYLRVPSHRVEVIYNGIEPKEYQRQFSAPFTPLDFAEDLPVVGTVARLEHRKGIRYLIKALPLIERKYKPVNCVVIGEGPERDALEKMVEELSLTDRVKFLGFQEDIVQFIRLFDVVVIPSVQEGQSIFCLEALACKRPVVASAVGGIPEIIRHEETGILVPPADPEAIADAVITLLRDQEMAKRLAETGQKLVFDKFTQEQMLIKTEEVYERVLDGRG
ncbi:MAG: glycosyltransferase family 4 protein [Thermacetogeniaceae bacterium]